LFEALVISALLAYLLAPLVGGLMRRFHLRRTFSVLIVYVIILLVIASLPTALGFLAVEQFQNFSITLTEVGQEVQRWISRPITFLGFTMLPRTIVDNAIRSIAGILTIAPGGSLNILAGLTTNLLWALAIFISLYYFLVDGPKIKPWLVSLFPREYQSDVDILLGEVNDVWSVFLRVQMFIFIVLIILFILGTLLVVVLYRAGLVPFSWIGLVIMLLIVYALVQQVDNLWLRPQLLGHRLKLHPAVVFVGLVGALALSGVLGALIVVPAIATVKVVGRYVRCKLLGMDPWSDNPVEAELAADKADNQGEQPDSRAIPGEDVEGMPGKIP
jgi:predicted PurR-regulated permease PerM